MDTYIITFDKIKKEDYIKYKKNKMNIIKGLIIKYILQYHVYTNEEQKKAEFRWY